MPPTFLTIYIISMTIKNKNGTEYQVRKPNPLMKEQAAWDNYVTHNMEFVGNSMSKMANTDLSSIRVEIGQTYKQKENLQKTEIIKIDLETPKPTLPPPLPTMSSVKEIIQDIINETPSPQKTIDEIMIEGKTIEKPNKINEKLKNYPKNIMNCLLAKVEEKIDYLYEDRTFKLKYIKEIAFESIILSQTDYEMIFWTHLEYISKHSVVYPINKTKRWWKIEKIQKAPEGFFCSCVPSSIQPSFKH